MNVSFQPIKTFPVTIGNFTLYLSAYQVSGGCQFREQGTADGSTAVASLWAKGSQITLEGRLAGNAQNAILSLDALARSRVGISLQIGAVSSSNAVLIAYSIKENQESIFVSVTFYSSAPLVDENEQEEEFS